MKRTIDEVAIRADERQKVYDELGVLTGEDARRFHEEIENPAPQTQAAKDMIRHAHEIVLDWE